MTAPVMAPPATGPRNAVARPPMTMPAATYFQLLASQLPAAARPVVCASFHACRSASLSGLRPVGSDRLTGSLPA